MIKQKKIEEVAKLTENLNKAKIVILTEYRGLNAAEMTELRKKLMEAGTHYKVVKNTFTKRAFISINDKNLYETIEKLLVGPVALAFNFEDYVKPTRVLRDFSKEHEALRIKGGILGTKILTVDDINTLANLPSKEVLIGKVVVGLKAPINNLVFTLKGIISKFIHTLEAIKNQKKE